MLTSAHLRGFLSGEKGVRACATALTKQAGLQRLTLENVGARHVLSETPDMDFMKQHS